MSHYDELIKLVKAAAFDLGVPELAKRAGMSDDTLRRFLKSNPPQSLVFLKNLEAAALEHQAKS